MRFFFTLLASLPLTTALAGDLRLNSATAEEFAAVEGVDAQMAADIVALRSSRGGNLPSVEALRVLSLPPAALDSIREEAIIDLQVSTSRQSYGSVDEVLAEFSTEPDVRQAQAMAMAYTNTNPELVQGWLRASRSAYMLPKLNLPLPRPGICSCSRTCLYSALGLARTADLTLKNSWIFPCSSNF